jgi:hypothetical protein
VARGGELLDLEPGEEVLAVARASFRGAAATSTRATFALGSGRMRMKAFVTWYEAAQQSGFPQVPADMVVAVTPRRLLFGKPTFWGRPPRRYWSQIELDRIAEVAVVRHGIVTGVAFGFRHGAIVEVEALRGRALRNLVEVIEQHLHGS